MIENTFKKVTLMAAKKEDQNTYSYPQYYSKLIIYPKIRVGLFLITAILCLVFGVVIFQNMQSGNSWYILISPLFGLGLFLIGYPGTEEWQYVPWQTKPIKQERIFFR